MMSFLRVILVIAAVVLGAAFTLFNPGLVEVIFYPELYTVEVPMSIVVFASMALGLILGGLGSMMVLYRRGRESRRWQKRCRQAEEEVLRLREGEVSQG